MRRRATALVLALTGLVLAPAVANAQETGTKAPSTFTGVVVDSASGLPVAEAEVSIEAGQAVLTDSSGRFVFPDAPKEGQLSLTVDQLGYASYFAMVEVTAPAPTVRLVPDPAVLRGLRTVEAELRRAIGASASTRYFGRKELLSSHAQDLREFLVFHGAYAQRAFPRGPDDVMQSRSGSPSQPVIYIDGWSFSGVSSLPYHALTDLYGVAFTRGGAYIYIWSKTYIERLARTTGHFR